MRLFKKKYMYLEEVKKRRKADEVKTLPKLKRGRKMMLGEQLDTKVNSIARRWNPYWIKYRDGSW